MTFVEQLIARAFDRASPADANAAIEAVRRARGPQTFSYELFVPQLDAEGFFLRQAAPKLIQFLWDRGVRGPDASSLFISLFTADGLYFLSVRDLLEVTAAAAGTTAEAFWVNTRSGGTGAPLRLGST